MFYQNGDTISVVAVTELYALLKFPNESYVIYAQASPYRVLAAWQNGLTMWADYEEHETFNQFISRYNIKTE